MKDTRRVCLSCNELKSLSLNLGVCSSCRLRLFDDGGLAIMSMHNLYGIDKNTLQKMNNTGELIPEVNSEGNWRYTANSIKWYFVNNKDKLKSLITETNVKNDEIDKEIYTIDSNRPISTSIHEEEPRWIPMNEGLNKIDIESSEYTRGEDCIRCKNNNRASLILGLCNVCMDSVFNKFKISSTNISKLYMIPREELIALDKSGLFKANFKSGETWLYSKTNLISYLGYRDSLGISANSIEESRPSNVISEVSDINNKIVCEINSSIITSLVIIENEDSIRLCEKVRGFRVDKFKKGLTVPRLLFDEVVEDILQKGYSNRSDNECSVHTKLNYNKIIIEVIFNGNHYNKQKLSIDIDKIRALFSDYKSLL